MTTDILLVFAILTIALILLISERVRMDLVALLVLGALVLTGILTPTEALSGFSNPAVITVWAVFILSGGLTRTGIASEVGKYVLRLFGSSEIQLVLGIMLTAGLMSAFLNNIGVAALLLPVVMDIARKTGMPPSRLLMPLAFGSLMGGMTTLIGTPPNILVSDALRTAGLDPFRMFDYTPVGIAVLLVGVAFMVLLGRRLLPKRDTTKISAAAIVPQDALGEVYGFSERLFLVKLPEDAILAGKTLAESRLGSALGLNVIAIRRNGKNILAPVPNIILQPGDGLLVGGQLEPLDELRASRHIVLENDHLTTERLISKDVAVVEAHLDPDSSLLGHSVIDNNFHNRFGVNVIAIWRDDQPILANLQNLPLRADDILLIQGEFADLETFGRSEGIQSLSPIPAEEVSERYRLDERLITLRVPRDSVLVEQTLKESRLGDAFGLRVLGIIRDGKTNLMPTPEDELLANDMLIVEGDPEDLDALRGLKQLQIEHGAVFNLRDFESPDVGLAEVVLSPHTSRAGKTLRQLHFREKYGLSVLAAWREGRAYRSNIRDLPLRFGDALLVYGRRDRLRVLGSEPDFLVLTEAAQEPPRREKAPIAILIMLGVLASVVLGLLTIPIAGVIGSALMVVTGCLTMDDAYRYIEWKAVFLIAGLIPLGIAMEKTGTASFLAEGMVELVGDRGELAVIAGTFILTSFTSQVMPNAAVTVLMAPVALNTANDMAISPYSLMMAVAVAASASFMSPVAHPANSLVMGPGGYRFADYLKLGLPLTLLTLLVFLFVLPIFWPL
ncbi:MAG: SLC13 family permease [Anaerolineales bacterium]|nr:SLC13 family permease [Anaerolineales bacterium]